MRCNGANRLYASSKAPTMIMRKPPIIIGHRGAMGTCVENTLTAFHTAIAEEAGAIEFDVRRCKTGELLVIHDHAVLHQGVETDVETLSWSDLQHVKLPNPFEPDSPEDIPLLGDLFADEILRNAIDHGLVLCVEIKSHDAAAAITEYVRDAGLLDHTVIYSFDPDDLETAHSVSPTVRTNLLFGSDRDANLARAVEIGAWSVNPEVYDADEEFVRRAHDAGLQVSVGRTNDMTEIQRLLRLDVWGVHTDYPQRGAAVRNQLDAVK
jgi:glycerophosphoryl diester phosphodiesterase